MSNEEHYFENLLFAYSRGGIETYDKVTENDPNIRYLTDDVKRSIEICATYVIDCCNWEQNVLGDFLSGDWMPGSKWGSTYVQSSSQ